MKDFSTPRTFIFSADLSTVSAKDNERRAARCQNTLTRAGIPFRKARGSFEGEYETSFVVTGAEYQHAVFRVAQSFTQSTVLVVAEHDRTAYLVPVRDYPTASSAVTWSHLGVLRCNGDAEPAGDYTLVDGLYFTVEPTAGPNLKGGI